MRLEVAWTPCEAELFDVAGRTVVVVDVLRASTTVLAALEAGAARILPVATEEEARRIAAGLAGGGVLLCGERGGLRIEGFDLGNSPLEYTSERVSGRTLVYRTTNGTPVLRRAAERGASVLLAAFRNLGAVAETLLAEPAPPVIVCAGRAGRVSLDDVLCAGHLALRLRGSGMNDRGDGTEAAIAVAESLGPPTPDLLRSTDAGRALAGLGQECDLAFSAEVDRSGLVPVAVDGTELRRGRA